MGPSEWISLAGLFAVGVGMLIATFRVLQNQISANNNAIHERVNRVRDEYVKRIYLDSHLAHVDKSIEKLGADVKEGQRDIASRFDALILAVASNTRSQEEARAMRNPGPSRRANAG